MFFRTIGAALLVLMALTAWPSQTTHVVIMHTNDLHGHLQPARGAGGSAALATVVRRERPDLMLDAGDSFFGTMISNMFEGAPMIDVMNAIGYDAAVIGSHEFNFGVDGLARRLQQAHFPFVSANTNLNVANLGDAAIFTAQDIRFAVIGLTTRDLMKTHPEKMESVEVTDVVRAAENAMARVKDISDCVIFLTHLRPDEEVQLARAFPDVPLIIGGHEHAALENGVRIGKTTLVRTGSYGKFVGRVDLTFADKKLVSLESRLIPLEGVTPDQEIAELLKPYETRVSRDLDVVLGHAAGEMKQVDDLVADALRAATGTQITLNSARSTGAIPKGPVTERMVSQVVPFDNSVITMKLSGAHIKQILSRQLMNVSGLRLKYDAKKPVGKRLIKITLEDGSPLHDKVFYTVTTTDGVEDFQRDVEFRETGILVREAVSEHIRSVGTLIPKPDNRVQR